MPRRTGTRTRDGSAPGREKLSTRCPHRCQSASASIASVTWQEFLGRRATSAPTDSQPFEEWRPHANGEDDHRGKRRNIRTLKCVTVGGEGQRIVSARSRAAISRGDGAHDSGTWGMTHGGAPHTSITSPVSRTAAFDGVRPPRSVDPGAGRRRRSARCSRVGTAGSAPRRAERDTISRRIAECA